MICEFIDSCLFFNDRMQDMPPTSLVLKKLYCLGNNRNCARFMLKRSLGIESVPETLFPNESKEAQRLLSDRERSCATMPVGTAT